MSLQQPTPEAVRLHVNDYRQSHRARPVLYDSGLAKRAQNRASTLASRSSFPPTSETHLGNENAYVFVDADENKSSTQLTNDAVDVWYLQNNNFDFKYSPSITSKRVAMWGAADFARLVWRSTKRIGAGIARAGARTVVVVVFDPPGLGLLNQVDTNVLSSSSDLLDALDGYYDKGESDTRFLAANRIDDIIEEASEEATSNARSASSSNFDALRSEVRAFYVRRTDMEDIIADRLEVEDTATREWTLERLDERIEETEGMLNSNIDDLRDSAYTKSNVDAMFDDLMSNSIEPLEERVDEQETLLDEGYYDKDQADARFARDAAFQKVRDDLYGKYLDSAQLESQFVSRLRLEAFSNAVSDAFDEQQGSLCNISVDQIDEGELGVAHGGTGRSNLTVDKLLVGSGGDAVMTPDLLHWDASNVRLGVGTSDPSHALDVDGDSRSTGSATSARFLAASDGTPTDPAFSWSGADGTTSQAGMYRPDTKVLGFVTDGLERFRVDPEGRVGINTTSPNERLTVDGSIHATGEVTHSSDRRLKTNVRALEGSLDKVLRLSGYRFNRLDWESVGGEAGPSTEFIGFVAQEVLQVVPELVRYDRQGDRYGVNYAHVVVLLSEAFKSLHADTTRLEAEVRALRETVRGFT